MKFVWSFIIYPIILITVTVLVACMYFITGIVISKIDEKFSELYWKKRNSREKLVFAALGLLIGITYPIRAAAQIGMKFFEDSSLQMFG